MAGDLAPAFLGSAIHRAYLLLLAISTNLVRMTTIDSLAYTMLSLSLLLMLFPVVVEPKVLVPPFKRMPLP